MSKIVIIAEIGENHMGNTDTAKKLIRAARKAGADFVKFQSYRPENFRPDDPEYSWFRKVSLSDRAHRELKEYAEKCGIGFLSSPFSLERAKFLCETLGLKEIKIASGVMLNIPLLDYINTRPDTTVFISTGMATIDEIGHALAHLGKICDLYILHCTTQYPCEDEEANVRSIAGLRKAFPRYKIGYSDHTVGIEACLAAAALGAQAIEKHFTFDKAVKEGTDHVISVEPDELRNIVKSIRRIEVLLGSEEKFPTPGEQKIRDFVRNRFI